MRKRIKYLVMDVDGTLTDGKIYMGNSGEVCKAFNAKDGYGICNILIPAGIKPIILTGRTSRIVENRCMELGITEIYQGISDKLTKLNEILEHTNSDYSQVAYIGDDINDLICMTTIRNGGGVIGCPADAVESVKVEADFISKKNGGEGAVREFIEKICRNYSDEDLEISLI